MNLSLSPQSPRFSGAPAGTPIIQQRFNGLPRPWTPKYAKVSKFSKKLADVGYWCKYWCKPCKYLCCAQYHHISSKFSSIAFLTFLASYIYLLPCSVQFCRVQVAVHGLNSVELEMNEVATERHVQDPLSSIVVHCRPLDNWWPQGTAQWTTQRTTRTYGRTFIPLASLAFSCVVKRSWLDPSNCVLGADLQSDAEQYWIYWATPGLIGSYRTVCVRTKISSQQDPVDKERFTEFIPFYTACSMCHVV